ncbi:GTP 3',8-cyclase MoaA [Psychromonas sp. RZ22]|uniref:GTP 3',8-cyclase MoaA n=1 Tax=Psychromonas algarum TaxID=2555643 RepID=UPI001068156C|nr:GTP 3',8-cyclase MoaA [Psychromonas sp. RZ22]
MQLIDRYHRKFEYLRLSITDECNFKCNYCLPDGYQRTHQKQFLSQNEITNLINAFAELGTSKVRITGGEPSLRKDFADIISQISQTEGIKKVATTTNGFNLSKHAEQWFEAGLSAINVSVDSLDANTFNLITGKNIFHKVMEGVEACASAGFEQVKVNSVLMKGLNDNDLNTFLAWIKDHPIQLRFIELMQTEDNTEFFNRYHLSGQTIKSILLKQNWICKIRHVNDGPAEVFTHPDYVGEIGLIMPYSKDFCSHCNRLRVSAVGRLHLCLFGEEGVDLRHLLQNSSDKEQLKKTIISALQEKKATHFLDLGVSGGTPHLASIGG